MSTTAHRISDDGQTIVCESAPDARCRMAPDCDTETWHSSGCEDHDEEHPVLPGQDCWYLGHLNPVDLDETYGLQYEEGPPAIYPGKAVDVEFHAPDEGCSWTYAEAEPVQSMGWPDV